MTSISVSIESVKEQRAKSKDNVLDGLERGKYGFLIVKQMIVICMLLCF